MCGILLLNKICNSVLASFTQHNVLRLTHGIPRISTSLLFIAASYSMVWTYHT